MKNTGILQLVSVFQVANISFRKWDKHNPTPNQHEPKAFPANMHIFDTTFLWHLNHINIHAHMIYYICLSFQFFSFSFQGKQVVPKKSQAALRWRHGRSGSVDLAMILKSIEVASAAPEGAKVVMSSTCQPREQFRLKGLWICQKGYCCFEEVSSKICKSKLFHDEMKNLIDRYG